MRLILLVLLLGGKGSQVIYPRYDILIPLAKPYEVNLVCRVNPISVLSPLLQHS